MSVDSTFKQLLSMKYFNSSIKIYCYIYNLVCLGFWSPDDGGTLIECLYFLRLRQEISTSKYVVVVKSGKLIYITLPRILSECDDNQIYCCYTVVLYFNIIKYLWIDRKSVV